MLYEKSCGAILYRIVENVIQYLILKSVEPNSYWGFAKGHMDGVETEEETCLREVFEETGIRIEIEDNFRQVDKYVISKEVTKEVVIFLGKTKEQIVTIQQEEISEYKWCDYNAGIELLTFESSKEMLSKANKLLMEQANIKWLFFDIGYTLINEDRCHYKRIMDTIKRQRENQKEYSYDDIYALMVQASLAYRQPYPTAMKELGIQKLEPYPKELEVPYNNSISVLGKLHKVYKIGIIANQSAGTEKRLMDYGFMEHIDLVLSSTEEGLSKPDIRFFEKALLKASCLAKEAVMVGDRLDNDIFPAKCIGMKTVWIKQGFGGMQVPKSEEYEPDYIIENLDELIGIFLRMS